MANPIAIAAALSRTKAFTCPYCKFKKLVARRPKKCPNCLRALPDAKPEAKRKRR